MQTSLPAGQARRGAIVPPVLLFAYTQGMGASSLDEPSTSPSLLAAALAKQPEAWARFVHLYGPVIYRWIRRTGRQSSDAADITQDVLLSVSNSLSRFDVSRPEARFRAWLWVITRRRIADASREADTALHLGSAAIRLCDKGNRENGEPVSIDPHSPPTDAVLDTRTVVRRAVAVYRDRFDPRTWGAFWATVVEGREPAEVAESMGMNRWSVYKARARILQRLRTELAGLLDDPDDCSGKSRNE
ncbi:MAG: sigma-70 family RNA polymerase sigma factor [Planctomycetota bacterium]